MTTSDGKVRGYPCDYCHQPISFQYLPIHQCVPMLNEEITELKALLAERDATERILRADNARLQMMVKRLLGDPERLARAFHNTYERLAPTFGYETRPDTREFEASSKNGQLMIAVSAEIARAALALGSETERADRT